MTIRDDTMITKGSLGYLILDLPVQLEKVTLFTDGSFFPDPPELSLL